MTTTICYRLNNPFVFNEGTKWEKRHSDFLLYYWYRTKEEAEAKVAELNAEATDRVYYVSEQKEM